MELTILIPALNEEQTIEICIQKAMEFLKKNQIEGEVLVADNNSTDRTAILSKNAGARVITVAQKGYGNALREGTKQARGKYTIMGDADDSYNFLELEEFIIKLRQGYELVVGNRYQGKLEKGSMKLLNRYIGTPLISKLAGSIYQIPVGDFNCGLRGYHTQKVKELNCKASGMEYATEMLIRAKQEKLKIIEIPINFYQDKRNRGSHLKITRDGIRHLKIIMQNR